MQFVGSRFSNRLCAKCNNRIKQKQSTLSNVDAIRLKVNCNYSASSCAISTIWESVCIKMKSRRTRRIFRLGLNCQVNPSGNSDSYLTLMIIIHVESFIYIFFSTINTYYYISDCFFLVTLAR